MRLHLVASHCPRLVQRGGRLFDLGSNLLAYRQRLGHPFQAARIATDTGQRDGGFVRRGQSSIRRGSGQGGFLWEARALIFVRPIPVGVGGQLADRLTEGRDRETQRIQPFMIP